MVYCKRSDEEENNHFVHYLLAINDRLCQVRDPGKDASLDEHYDQVFHLVELLCTDTRYLPQEYHTPEEIGLSESFYTGTMESFKTSCGSN
jgi:hypothetical protein